MGWASRANPKSREHIGYDALLKVLEMARETCLRGAVALVEDDREISLDWDFASDKTLSVTVARNGHVAWAGLVGDWSGHGSGTESLADAMSRLSMDGQNADDDWYDRSEAMA
jgi:hypothetical protein